jgi:YVTN family beta-propeller protein
MHVRIQRRHAVSMLGSAVVLATCVAVLVPTSNAAASAVVSTISVGTNPTAVAINPAGTFAYVANVNSDSVSKIDLATDTVTATIAVPSPTAIAINSAGTYAWVVNNGCCGSFGHSISKINLATHVVTTISIAPNGSQPSSIAIRPDGAFAYVAIPDLGVVKKIDLSAGTVVGTIAVGPLPRRLAVTPNGASLIVTGGDIPNGGPAEIDVVNLANDSLASTQTVNDTLSGVSVAPGTTTAYATGGNAIYKINVATNTVDKTIQCACNPVGALAFRPQGDFAFIGTGTGLAKLDVDASVITAPDVPVAGSQVDSIAITADGRYGYTANRMLNTVTKVDLLSKVDQSISLPAPSTVPVTGTAESISPTATSGLPVTLSSETPTVCTAGGVTVTYVAAGECTLRAEQPGDATTWNAASPARRSFTVYLAPPTGEPGISINGASPYTNDANVTLGVVWPVFATAVRFANDGGFTAATTVTRDLATTQPWALDDSVKVLHTKIVYMRFSGLGIDASKTYTDDIVLDLTPPEITSAKARVISGATSKGMSEMARKKPNRRVVIPTVRVQVAARDRLSGVEAIQVTDRKAAPGVARDYATVTKLRTKKKTVFARVQDGAGNWSAWESVRVR